MTWRLGGRVYKALGDVKASQGTHDHCSSRCGGVYWCWVTCMPQLTWHRARTGAASSRCFATSGAFHCGRRGPSHKHTAVHQCRSVQQQGTGAVAHVHACPSGAGRATVVDDRSHWDAGSIQTRCYWLAGGSCTTSSGRAAASPICRSGGRCCLLPPRSCHIC